MTINQKIRLKYIDAFIGVERFFLRKYLERTFQVSGPQSSRNLCKYRGINPNAPYCPSKGATIPNEDFKMKFFRDEKEAQEYLKAVRSIYEVKPCTQSGGAE